MYIVIKENLYGLDSGVNIDGIFGPFSSCEEAQEFADRVSKADLYAIFYDVKKVELPEAEISFLNGLTMTGGNI